MSRMTFVIAGLGALALAACSTTPADSGTATSTTAPSTGSGTAPNGAQPTPPANQDGSPAPQQ
jgi:hypothetical protein